MRLLLCAALVAVPGSFDAVADSQRDRPLQERPSFRAEVHLRMVPVTVTNGDRIPIPDLTVDDFEIYDDGRRQQIAFLLTPEHARLELAVVVDASGSVERRVPQIRQLLAEFLRGLDPGDCILTLPFGGENVGPGFWNIDVENFALNLGFGGHTRLYDAINAALRGLGGDADAPVSLARGGDCGSALPGGDRRQGIVLITDGIDTLSYASFGETLINLWEAQIPMIVLEIPTGIVPGIATRVKRRAKRRRQELTELANVSGGALIRADEGREARAFGEILERLRSTYLIGYYLSDPPETPLATWRPIEVRVRDDTVRAAAPEGVYVSVSRPSEAAQWGQEGRSFLGAGDYERAMEYAQRATAARWETPDAHYLRAIAALRMGQVEVAENAARWAVFFEPTNERFRAIFRDLGAAAGESPQRSESPPIGTIWIAAASHRSVPLQQAGFHMARIVASHVLGSSDINVTRRPRRAGPGHGLEVWVRDIDGGRIKGEIVLVDENMDMMDDADFELTSAEARLSARDVPPTATQELGETIDELLERLRARQRSPG